jgi:hypothetical protein
MESGIGSLEHIQDIEKQLEGEKMIQKAILFK